MHENHVELIGFYGGDIEHALSAWTSTVRELTEERKERIGQVLDYLASHGHHTPFEKSSLHFLVDVETASHIHVIKHRIGVSVNAESARYKEHKQDNFYLPQDWGVEEQERLKDHCLLSFARYHDCLARLEAKGFTRKRAKESARFYLPYASQLKMDVMFNFRSFMHFQGLRGKPDAQLEIREVAYDMLRLVRQTGKFDMSLEAFGYGVSE